MGETQIFPDYIFESFLSQAIEEVRQASARRLAAIPLSNASEFPALEADSSLPMLGAASVGLMCVGYALRRRCLQAKQRRDSFGFLPDSRRDSLNACELNV